MKLKLLLTLSLLITICGCSSGGGESDEVVTNETLYIRSFDDGIEQLEHLVDILNSDDRSTSAAENLKKNLTAFLYQENRSQTLGFTTERLDKVHAVLNKLLEEVHDDILEEINLKELVSFEYLYMQNKTLRRDLEDSWLVARINSFETPNNLGLEPLILATYAHPLKLLGPSSAQLSLKGLAIYARKFTLPNTNHNWLNYAMREAIRYVSNHNELINDNLILNAAMLYEKEPSEDLRKIATTTKLDLKKMSRLKYLKAQETLASALIRDEVIHNIDINPNETNELLIIRNDFNEMTKAKIEILKKDKLEKESFEKFSMAIKKLSKKYYRKDIYYKVISETQDDIKISADYIPAGITNFYKNVTITAPSGILTFHPFSLIDTNGHDMIFENNQMVVAPAVITKAIKPLKPRSRNFDDYLNLKAPYQKDENTAPELNDYEEIVNWDITQTPGLPGVKSGDINFNNAILKGKAILYLEGGDGGEGADGIKAPELEIKNELLHCYDYESCSSSSQTFGTYKSVKNKSRSASSCLRRASGRAYKVVDYELERPYVPGNQFGFGSGDYFGMTTEHWTVCYYNAWPYRDPNIQPGKQGARGSSGKLLKLFPSVDGKALVYTGN